MPKTILNIAISVDGYVANTDDSIDWLQPYDNLSEYGFDDFISNIGAIIMGNRSYDIGIKNDWFKDNPYGPSPIFVVCTNKPSIEPADGNFRFIDKGIDEAYGLAKSAAGDKNVYLFGGPNIVQQLLNKGLVDELQLSVAPVILGNGIPLFAHLDERKINLERIEVKPYADGLTSLHYKILK